MNALDRKVLTKAMLNDYMDLLNGTSKGTLNIAPKLLPDLIGRLSKEIDAAHEKMFKEIDEARAKGERLRNES